MKLEHEFDEICLAVGMRMMLMIGQMHNYGASHIEQWIKTFVMPEKSEQHYFIKAQVDLEQWLLWMSSTEAMKKQQYDQGTYPEEFVMLCSKFAVETIADRVNQLMEAQ